MRLVHDRGRDRFVRAVDVWGVVQGLQPHSGEFRFVIRDLVDELVKRFFCGHG